METVADLVHAKARPGVVSISPAATVREATVLMNDHGIGALVVMTGRRLVGIFTERDVLRRVVAESRSPDAALVGEVMTADVLCCSPETGVDEVADLMRCRRVRHVPVVDQAAGLVGLVSIGDVNARRFACCETALHQVQDYILRRS
jgi:CBS domain-containing protein